MQLQQTHTLLDHTQRICDDRESGTLTLSRGDQRVDVFYREGMIDAVSSNSDLHRLGHYLVKEGCLQSNDLDVLLSESRRDNRSLGEAAILKKFVEPAELGQIVRLQAIDLLTLAIAKDYSVDEFNPGLHAFYVPARISFTHLLLELYRSDTPPLDPDPTQWMVLSNDIGLSEMPWYPEEVSVLNELRRPNTFPGLLTSLGMRDDSLKKILGVLRRLGLLEMSSCGPTKAEDESPSGFCLERLIPVVTNAVSNEKLEIRQNAASFISEQFKTLKVRLNHGSSDKPIQVLAVSSAESQEGKSLVTSNLAVAFSMDPGRRVIVVDCDLRNPTLDKYLGVSLEPGLLGYLIKSHLKPGCFMRKSENLFFMTTGGIASNPIELLSLDKMKDLISYLKTEFDTIVLDSPPFSPIADARVIVGLSDGMVMVVRSGKTSHRALERALKLVDRKKLLGVVFNDVKPMLFNTDHAYGYYHQYGQYGQYPYYGQRKARSASKNYLES